MKIAIVLFRDFPKNVSDVSRHKDLHNYNILFKLALLPPHNYIIEEKLCNSKYFEFCKNRLICKNRINLFGVFDFISRIFIDAPRYYQYHSIYALYSKNPVQYRPYKFCFFINSRFFSIVYKNIYARKIKRSIFIFLC